MESKAAYTLSRRIIQEFMDIIILKHMENGRTMSGYDVIKYLHKKFHMLPSTGTVYSLLYSLERQNLIKGNMNQRRRVYRLTKQGEEFLREIRVTKNHIHSVLSSIFPEVQS